MTDHTELKRLAEACGDFNWRFLTEKLTEYGIRDDHGYIAFLPVGHPAKYGACPVREAKAKFLGAMTPGAVLALLDDLDEARNGMKYACGMRLKKEIDRLQAENEALRSDAEQWRALVDRAKSPLSKEVTP